MLDKRKIRLMTRMSAYEKKDYQKDLRISTYFKKDYASLNTVITILWITIGYVLIAGIFALCNIEGLLENLNFEKMILLGGIAIGLYLVLIIIYAVCSSNFYKGKHNQAKRRIKRYYRDLSCLEKINMKEKR